MMDKNLKFFVDKKVAADENFDENKIWFSVVKVSWRMADTAEAKHETRLVSAFPKNFQ